MHTNSMPHVPNQPVFCRSMVISRLFAARPCSIITLLTGMAPSKTSCALSVLLSAPSWSGSTIESILPTGTAPRGSNRTASCRAVGWSNTTVEGSKTPDATCSWLRSSIAPKGKAVKRIRGKVEVPSRRRDKDQR